MLTRLAHLTIRHRWATVGTWLILTLFGVFAAHKVSTRWNQTLSAPGGSAYEASQRTLKDFGVGDRLPETVVFHTQADATRSHAIERAMRHAAAVMPGALVSSYFSTGSLAYVSRDRHTTFEEIYPPGSAQLNMASGADRVRAAAAKGLPEGITVGVTGHDPVEEASAHGSSGGPKVLVETGIGALGALVILLLVFGTLPAVLMPLAVAAAAILNMFTLAWALTYLTNVSVIVQVLIALVGLGVAIDYALLMIFRFRDELREGKDVEAAVVQTMTHAGRSVILSGSTVAVGLLSMTVVPLPFIRSMGIAGALIPAVSVLASLTLLPALLSILGERINSVRVMPRRLLGRGHPEHGAWGRWARLVLRRPAAAAGAGLAIIGVLAALGTQLHPSNPQLKYIPGSGTAIAARQMLAGANITPGSMEPLDVLVEHGGNARQIAASVRAVPGISAATAPPTWHRGQNSLIEAFASTDGSAPGIQATIDRVNAALTGTHGTLTGGPAVNRDFVHALLGGVPYVLALMMVLTLILLARAFRSIVLAIKAALLNLISLAAAFGTVVLVFQQGHGSSLWGMGGTQSITPWIPVLIFALLFGLSMDYEVFMLTRMREAYDKTGSTEKAIELGLARTAKLVTSGALILMFAFLVLSTSPSYEVKPLAIGLAAGIILDATVIRALLVPALMRLLGEANWWMPRWTRVALRIPDPQPATAIARCSPGTAAGRRGGTWLVAAQATKQK